MTSTLSTSPAGFVMATTERLPLSFDTTPLLGVGQTPSAPAVVLMDSTTGTPVTLADAPTILNNIITQIVRGSVLTTGHKYALEVTFTAAANTVWTMVLTISCPAIG